MQYTLQLWILSYTQIDIVRNVCVWLGGCMCATSVHSYKENRGLRALMNLVTAIANTFPRAVLN